MNLKNLLTQVKNNLIKGIVLLMLLILIQAFSIPDYFYTETTFNTNTLYKDSAEKWLSSWSLGNIILKSKDCKRYGRDFYVVKEMFYPSSSGTISNSILSIYLKSNNNLYVQYERVSKRKGLNYIKNLIEKNLIYKSKEPPKMEKIELKNLGEFNVPWATAIGITYSEKTDIKKLDKLLRDIGIIYLHVKNETSEKYYKKNYFELTKDEKLNIDMLIPVRLVIVIPIGVD